MNTRVLCALALLVTVAPLWGQGLDPAAVGKPAIDAWTTYTGDYSGQRYSPLTQINRANVHQLTLAWVGRIAGGTSDRAIVGGEAPMPPPGNEIPRVAGSLLQVDGVLYITAPDHAWAMDARTGAILWHYFWKTRGGTHIGNRGMGMYRDRVYFETPDDYLVCLDAKTGQERWHREIAPFSQQYFSTFPPTVIGNHLLIGTGNDMDAPGFLRSVDPETGDTQWTWYATPQAPGDKGAETWPDINAARYGGGNVWVPGVYDPELHLYYVGTGNPTPAFSSGTRAGDNLHTASIVAINVDTGKLAWAFQVTPHDTHDYDAAQTPIIVDAPFNGRMRKLLLHASRNGHFFVFDRVTGEHLLTTSMSASANWMRGIDAKGAPIPDPLKAPQPGGALVSPSNPGVTNWPPHAFDPVTGHYFVQTRSTYSVFYLTDPDPKEAQGFGGAQEQSLGTVSHSLTAIDYRTGKIAWQHEYPITSATASAFGGGGLPGLLATAGRLVFGGDPFGNLVAYDPANGAILWHTRLGRTQIANAPQTYLLDGRQYLIVAAGDSIFAFTVAGRSPSR